MEGNCRIRELRKEEIGEALDLVLRVFQAYEAPDYTEEGVETFYQSVHEEGYLAQLRWYGAFAPEALGRGRSSWESWRRRGATSPCSLWRESATGRASGSVFSRRRKPTTVRRG